MLKCFQRWGRNSLTWTDVVFVSCGQTAASVSACESVTSPHRDGETRSHWDSPHHMDDQLSLFCPSSSVLSDEDWALKTFRYMKINFTYSYLISSEFVASWSSCKDSLIILQIESAARVCFWMKLSSQFPPVTTCRCCFYHFLWQQSISSYQLGLFEIEFDGEMTERGREKQRERWRWKEQSAGSLQEFLVSAGRCLCLCHLFSFLLLLLFAVPPLLLIFDLTNPPWPRVGCEQRLL